MDAVKRFIKIGRGRELAHDAGMIFYHQLKYLEPIIDDYKERGLWQEAERISKCDRGTFRDYINKHKRSDSELREDDLYQKTEKLSDKNNILMNKLCES